MTVSMLLVCLPPKAGIYQSRRILQADMPHSAPPRPIIPLPPQLIPAGREDPSPRSRNDSPPKAQVSSSKTPFHLSPLLMSQIHHQLLLRIQQELEVLSSRVQACPSLHSRRVLREVSDSEREAIRDEDWLDISALYSSAGVSPPTSSPSSDSVEGEKVIAFLEIGTPEDQIGRLFHSDPTRVPKVDRTKDPRDVRATTKGVKKIKPTRDQAPDRPERVLCPLVQSVDPFLFDKSTPSSTASLGIPFYQLSALFEPGQLVHLASRLAYLYHLSHSPPLSSLPLPASPPPKKTYALLMHPALLSSYGVDPFPLFRALWRLRMWKDECAGWDGDSRLRLWDSFVKQGKGITEDDLMMKEQGEQERFKKRIKESFGIDI